jgi:hypothetical protein
MTETTETTVEIASTLPPLKQLRLIMDIGASSNVRVMLSREDVKLFLPALEAVMEQAARAEASAREVERLRSALAIEADDARRERDRWAHVGQAAQEMYHEGRMTTAGRILRIIDDATP